MNRLLRQSLLLFMPIATALAGTGLRVLADEGHEIIQKGRAFHPKEVTIGIGETLEFDNQDEFIHQIYVASDQIKYDSVEQPPGQKLHVTFTAAGTFPVRCHIHPKMLLNVTVK